MSMVPFPTAADVAVAALRRARPVHAMLVRMRSEARGVGIQIEIELELEKLVASFSEWKQRTPATETLLRCVSGKAPPFQLAGSRTGAGAGEGDGFGAWQMEMGMGMGMEIFALWRGSIQNYSCLCFGL